MRTQKTGRAEQRKHAKQRIAQGEPKTEKQMKLKVSDQLFYSCRLRPLRMHVKHNMPARRPKTFTRRPQDGPRGSQDTRRRTPDAPKTPPARFQNGPRCPQNAPSCNSEPNGIVAGALYVGVCFSASMNLGTRIFHVSTMGLREHWGIPVLLLQNMSR